MQEPSGIVESMSKTRKQKTKEPQYSVHVANVEKNGPGVMGLTTSYFWEHDPKHLLFTLARYKFVAKMFDGLQYVAEFGCGDGFGTRLVAKSVEHVDGYDFDPVFIDNARDVNARVSNASFFIHDVLKKKVGKKYDGICALDVIEHINKRQERVFMRNIVAALTPHGMCLLGTPNITSQVYASKPSKEGHINCKSYEELRKLMRAYFHNGMLFSMNDEVVHTGYGPMAHYLFCLGVCPRRLPAKIQR